MATSETLVHDDDGKVEIGTLMKRHVDLGLSPSFSVQSALGT
jgi:hypothetical protein